MANQYVNKFILGDEVKFDLTNDDITPEKLAKGIKAHDKTGAPITGTYVPKTMTVTGTTLHLAPAAVNGTAAVIS